MKFLTLLIISVWAFLYISCTSSKSSTSKEVLGDLKLKVVSAEITIWKGAIEGNTGEKITLKFIGKDYKNVLSDSAWYGEDKGFKSNYTIINDTLVVYGNYSSSENVKLIDIENGNSKSGSLKVSPPFKYNGEALVRFYHKGQTKFIEVPKFTKKSK